MENVSIRSKTGPLPVKLREQAERRVGKIGRYFNTVNSIEVVYSNARGLATIEISVDGDGLLLRCEERSADLVAALDNAFEKLERQIIRYKDRRREERRRQVARDQVSGEPGPLDEVAPRIVRRKRFTMKPVSEVEAAEQMELTGHDWFLFRNASTGEINVLYRRQDGNYGLIEPGD